MIEHSITIAGVTTPLLLQEASAEPLNVVVILAHGAGSHMAHRTAAWQAALLRDAGADVVRFNFLYRAAGRSAPDGMAKLKACYAAVAAWTRCSRPRHRLVLGGHSMGGRVASVLASEGLACDGVLLFAYPLHAPGKPERLRDAHLSAIERPVLCFNGTRDAYCTVELMEAVTAPLAGNWQQHWVAGGDHSFQVLKRSGRTAEDVVAEVAQVLRPWLRSLE